MWRRVVSRQTQTFAESWCLHLQDNASSSPKMKAAGWAKTLLHIYHCTLRPNPVDRYYSLLVWIRREREVQTLILRRRREELYVPCHGKPGQKYSNLGTPWAGHFYYVHQDLKRRKHFSVYHTTGITGLPAMLSVTGPPQSSSKLNLIVTCITKQVTILWNY